MYPVVMNDELLGYIPFYGLEASFYDLSEGEIELIAEAPVQASLTPFRGQSQCHLYYLAIGDRSGCIKALRDVGEILNEGIDITV